MTKLRINNFFLTILMLISFFGFSQNKETVTKQLKKAISSQNPDNITLFFNEWNKKYKSNKPKNDTLQLVYQVFKTFYQPNQMQNLGTWVWQPTTTFPKRRLVIQYQMPYAVFNFEENLLTSRNYIPVDTIQNFRPKINYPKNKILYLTPAYEAGLRAVLNQHIQLGNNIPTSLIFDEKTEQTYHLLKEHITIFRRNWKYDWRFVDYPEVTKIIIHPNLQKAKVYFNVALQTGETDLSFINHQWVITKSSNSWIE